MDLFLLDGRRGTEGSGKPEIDPFTVSLGEV